MNSVEPTDKPGLIPGHKPGVLTIKWDNGVIKHFNPTSDHITGKPYYEHKTRKEDEEKITYTWDEPVRKDPGADYNPGKFKHLDEAIRNSKKG